MFNKLRLLLANGLPLDGVPLRVFFPLKTQLISNKFTPFHELAVYQVELTGRTTQLSFQIE